VEFEDYIWRDLHNAHVKEGLRGATLSMETIEGREFSIDSLPKAQAHRSDELFCRPSSSARLDGPPSWTAVAVPMSRIKIAISFKIDPSWRGALGAGGKNSFDPFMSNP
jgi:hypothetical protein